MTYKFTNRAKKAVEFANEIAIELGHNYIGTEHILYGILREGDCIAARILLELNVNIPRLYNEIVPTKICHVQENVVRRAHEVPTR